MTDRPEALERFKALYLTEYGEELTEEDASRKARTLLNLYIAVYKSPIELIREDELTNLTT